MHDFTSHLLRSYFQATDWHPYHSYLHLTSSSSSILLDFPIPAGLSFSISSSPSDVFFSNHRLRALPQLTGSLGYVYASTARPLQGFGIARTKSGTPSSGGKESINSPGSGDNSSTFLHEVIDRFRIVNVPSRPQSQRPEIWQGGERVEGRDYLLYGCIHAPTARLDALYTTRIAPTWNLIVTACSFPPTVWPQDGTMGYSGVPGSDANGQQVQQQGAQGGPTSPGATNLQMTLQNDTGKWFNEFSYSVDDALWGFRTMHHFGSSKRDVGNAFSSAGTGSSDTSSTLSGSDALAAAAAASGAAVIDDDVTASEEAGGGLKGRFSAGAELFLSTAEKSAGLSTGVRFTTLPEAAEDAFVTSDAINAGSMSSSSSPLADGGALSSPGRTSGLSGVSGSNHSVVAPPSQPPTTITATLNPMMGHLSTAYATRIGRDVVACSRYDFNVYSYESQLTVGGEYWLMTAGNLVPSLSSSSTAREDDNADANELPDRRSSDLQARPLPADVSLRDRDLRTRSAVTNAASPSSQEASHSANNTVSARLQESPASRPTSSTPKKDAARPRAKGRDHGKAVQTGADSNTMRPSPVIPVQTPLQTSRPATQATGLLKWSLNSSLLLSLLWQGRLRDNCIVAIGVRADLSGSGSGTSGRRVPRSGRGVGNVVKGMGMDVVYWGGGGGGGEGDRDGSSAQEGGRDGAESGGLRQTFV